MIAIRRLRALLCALACCVFADLSCAEGPAPPADGVPFPPDQKACVLVVGDGGASIVLPDPAADKAWVEADRSVTNAFAAVLAKNGYATNNAFIEQAQRSTTHSTTVPLAMAARCARTLQITHWVGSDAQGPCVMFTATVSHMLNSASGAARGNAISIPIDFVQSYRFPASPEAVRTNALAEAMLSDLRASGQIEFARLGTLPPASGRLMSPSGEEFTGQAGQAQADSPLYPADAQPCVMISAGAIPNSKGFPDPVTEKFWIDTDRKVLAGMIEALTHRGYRAAHVFTDIEHRSTNPTPTLLALRKYKCPTIISIAHQGGEDAQHQRNFGFSVGVVHSVFANAAGDAEPPAVVTEFTKEYAFPLSQERLDAFRPADFGAKVVADLLPSVKIDFARSGNLPKPPEAEPAAAPEGPPVEPQVLQRSYEAYVQRWAGLDIKEVHLRQIVVASNGDARAALERLRKGDAFDVVARESGASPASRDAGGDMGWNQLGALPVDLAFVVQAIEPRGLATRPARTTQGWAVVELLEMRQAAVPSFDAVKGRLEAAILARQAASAAGR